MTSYHPGYSVRVKLGNNPDGRVEDRCLVRTSASVHTGRFATAPWCPVGAAMAPPPHSVFEGVLRVKRKMHNTPPKRNANDRQAERKSPSASLEMKKKQHELDTTPYQHPNTVLKLLVFMVVMLTTIQSESRWTSTYSQWDFASWELF